MEAPAVAPAVPGMETPFQGEVNVNVTRTWRKRAVKLNIARVDIETTAVAFAATESWLRAR